MKNGLIKVLLLFEITILLYFYLSSVVGISHLFLMIIGFYPALRLIIDLILIGFSIVDDEWMRKFVHNKTKGRVPYYKSWKERFMGIQFWVFLLFLVYILSVFF